MQINNRYQQYEPILWMIGVLVNNSLSKNEQVCQSLFQPNIILLYRYNKFHLKRLLLFANLFRIKYA